MAHELLARHLPLPVISSSVQLDALQRHIQVTYAHLAHTRAVIAQAQSTLAQANAALRRSVVR